MTLTFRPRVLLAAFKDAWPIWLVTGGVGLSIVLGLVGGGSTPSALVRYAGTWLQLFGLGTVALGLSQVRSSFGRPSVLQRGAAWIKSFAAAFLTPPPTTVQAQAAGSSFVVGRARSILKPVPGATLEQRIQALESGLDRLREETDTTESELRTQIQTLKRLLSEEGRARQTEAKSIAAKLEELAVGGLYLEIVGVTWLALGVIGTSIPEEVAWFVGLFSKAL